MLKSKYVTKKCSCGQRITVEYRYCHEARTGIPAGFYNNDELLGWGMDIDLCPKCETELSYDELEVV